MTWLDTKGAQSSFVNGEVLFKWVNSLEQYRHKTTQMQRDHANSANAKKNKAYKRWRENRPRDEETTLALKVWWLFGLCSSFFFCSMFASASCLFLSSASLSLSLLIPAFFSPVSIDFICRKMEQRRVFLVFLLLSLSCSFFFFFIHLAKEAYIA